MTTTYYIPPDHINGDQILLPADEARHAVQVLRHKVGDFIVGVDGVGGWNYIELTEVGKKRVAGRIVESRQEVGESSVHLTLAVGVLKNQKRFEIFVEKACELGVSRIIPLHSQRTEKPSIRKERLEKILVAAMKQSGRSRLVDIDEVTAFESLVCNSSSEVKLICHERAPEVNTLLKILDTNPGEVLIAIGPEGGFSEEEVQQAEDHGFQTVYLGNRRLRAETAAITACAGIMIAAESQNHQT